MVQQSVSEVELAQIVTQRSTAGDWKASAKSLMEQLVQQGLTPSMRDELWTEVEEEVMCSRSLDSSPSLSPNTNYQINR